MVELYLCLGLNVWIKKLGIEDMSNNIVGEIVDFAKCKQYIEWLEMVENKKSMFGESTSREIVTFLVLGKLLVKNILLLSALVCSNL